MYTFQLNTSLRFFYVGGIVLLKQVTKIKEAIPLSLLPGDKSLIK